MIITHNLGSSLLQDKFSIPASPSAYGSRFPQFASHTKHTTTSYLPSSATKSVVVFVFTLMAMASLIQCSVTSFSATRGGDSTAFFSPFTTRFSKTHRCRVRCSLDDKVSDMSVNGLYFPRGILIQFSMLHLS